MSDNGKVYCTVRIDDKRCNRCYECIQACSTSALSLDGATFIHDPDDCSYCEVCMDVCPEEALEILER